MTCTGGNRKKKFRLSRRNGAGWTSKRCTTVQNKGEDEMADGWDLAAKARLDFADVLADLSDEQLKASTFCEQWNALEVGGHIVSFIEMSLPTMMFSMAKTGFNIDKAWANNGRKYAAQGADEVVRKIRANPAKKSAVKAFPAELTVGDVAIHTQDIRRPLGLEGELDPEVLRGALDMCTSHDKAKLFVPPKDIEGLRLEATDMDWSYGSGDLVSGTGEALLMAINRRDTRAELTGDGVAKLPR